MKINVVGMIYKSINYLDFMIYNINKYCLDDNIDYNIIANNATDKVLSYLKNNNIKHIVYEDPFPDDYYLNRVYRAWNFGGFNTDCDILIFINSDMAFTPYWINNLIKNLTLFTIPCSRLIESTKLKSGQHAIEKNFGQNSNQFDEIEFIKYCNNISSNEIKTGGLFMPCAFYKQDFVESNGYPEGNIYVDGIGKHKSPIIMSGDYYFFYKNPIMKNKSHITVFNSLVYHIQEGEKDE